MKQNKTKNKEKELEQCILDFMSSREQKQELSEVRYIRVKDLVELKKDLEKKGCAHKMHIQMVGDKNTYLIELDLN